MSTVLCKGLVSAFFLISAVQAQAAIYSDFQSWNAALSGPSTTETFESYDFENANSPSDHFVNLNFFESFGNLLTVTQLPYTSGDYLGVSNSFTSDASFLDSNYLAIKAPRDLTFQLPDGATAFGFSFADLKGSPVEFQIQITQDGVGNTYRVNSSADAYSFFGAISLEPIDYVLITNSSPSTAGTYAAIDNFSLGPLPPPVPEPETYAMMLTGLGLMGWIMRRKSSWKK